MSFFRVDAPWSQVECTLQMLEIINSNWTGLDWTGLAENLNFCICP